MPAPTRKDSENLQRLEELRPLYEALKAARIRAESDIERLTRELDEARQSALEQLGTDDEDEIRRMIEAARVRNTQAVEAFAATLRSIAARLEAAAEDP